VTSTRLPVFVRCHFPWQSVLGVPKMPKKCDQLVELTVDIAD
jgi:hypothetical protein